MKNKLSYNEVNEIRNWLKSRRINYLDIREELTDHFASKIELIQSEEGHSFSRAFLQARQGFYPSRFKINYLIISFFKNFALWFWEIKKIFTSPLWIGIVLIGLGMIASFLYNILPLDVFQPYVDTPIIIFLFLVLLGESIFTKAKTKNAGYITLLCSSYLFHYFFLFVMWRILGNTLTETTELMIYLSTNYIFSIAWVKLLIAKRMEAHRIYKLYLKTL